MTEMKEKIYPELPTIREQPTAPNVVNGGEDDRGHSYRLNYIQDVQRFLEEEIKQREAFSKKYFRISRIIHIVDNGLSVVTLGIGGTGGTLVVTGVGAPIGAALAISGAAIGGITIIGEFCSRKAVFKAMKHKEIRALAVSKLNTVASHISKALMDDFISNEEFNLILEEMNKYKMLKEEIRNNTKKKLKKEEEESLIEKGRQEERNTFRMLYEKRNKGKQEDTSSFRKLVEEKHGGALAY